MRNFEAYYGEIKNTFSQGINLSCAVKIIRCPNDTMFRCDGDCLMCEKNNLKWLYEEYKGGLNE